MKYSLITTPLLLSTVVVTALPTSNLERRGDPPPNPVTFDHLPTTSFTCGTTQYSSRDIYLAAQYGVLLAASHPPQYRGKKSPQYPNGRFPHSFLHNKNNHPLTFPSYCPDGDADRAEYPLVKNGPYNGGPNNNKWGNDRVVYVYEAGEVDNSGHDKATFCGVMTHTGAPEVGAFVLCSSP